jgi:hypothetical protein
VEETTRLSVFGGGDRADSGPAAGGGAAFVRVLERLVTAIEGVRAEQKRIADHFDPPPPDVVGTDYVATELSCTKVWVSQMARDGEIPADCIVPGTGNGKPWKFRRSGIDRWLAGR